MYIIYISKEKKHCYISTFLINNCSLSRKNTTRNEQLTWKMCQYQQKIENKYQQTKLAVLQTLFDCHAISGNLPWTPQHWLPSWSNTAKINTTKISQSTRVVTLNISVLPHYVQLWHCKDSTTNDLLMLVSLFIWNHGSEQQWFETESGSLITISLLLFAFTSFISNLQIKYTQKMVKTPPPQNSYLSGSNDPMSKLTLVQVKVINRNILC